MRKETEGAKNDFTVGAPLPKLVRFALPIVAVYILQQFYNTADTLVVGRFVGENALAAVGSSGQVTGVVLALISGATLGMSVVVSQYFGAKDEVRLKKSIMTSLYMVIGLSLIFSVFGAALARPLLRLMQTPENILDDATLYLRIIFLGSLATAMYNAANSVSRSLGDSMTPMIVLVICAILNVGLNLLFVAVFRMGVAGVGYATVLASALSAVACVWILCRKMPVVIPQKESMPWDGEVALSVTKIGVPSALQSASMALGNVTLQGLVNSFGSTVIAGFSAATRIDNLISWPPGGFTNAMQYYTGQNIGAGKPERIKQGVRVTLLVVIAYSLAAAAITIPLRFKLMALFSREGGEMIAVGARYLLIVALFWSGAGINHCFKSLLTGAGDAAAAVWVSAGEMGARIIFSFVLSHFIGWGGLAVGVPVGWFTASLLGWLLYRKGNWKKKSVVRNDAAENAEA